MLQPSRGANIGVKEKTVSFSQPHSSMVMDIISPSSCASTCLSYACHFSLWGQRGKWKEGKDDRIREQWEKKWHGGAKKRNQKVYFCLKWSNIIKVAPQKAAHSWLLLLSLHYYFFFFLPVSTSSISGWAAGGGCGEGCQRQRRLTKWWTSCFANSPKNAPNKLGFNWSTKNHFLPFLRFTTLEVKRRICRWCWLNQF